MISRRSFLVGALAAGVGVRGKPPKPTPTPTPTPSAGVYQDLYTNTY